MWNIKTLDWKTQKTDKWLSELGVGVGEMSESSQKIQTSSYRRNKINAGDSMYSAVTTVNHNVLKSGFVFFFYFQDQLYSWSVPMHLNTFFPSSHNVSGKRKETILKPTCYSWKFYSCQYKDTINLYNPISWGWNTKHTEQNILLWKRKINSVFCNCPKLL